MLLQEIIRGVRNGKMLFVFIASLLLMFLSDYASVFKLMTFADLDAPDLRGNDQAIQHLVTNGWNTYHVWIKSFDFLALIFPLLAALPYASSFLIERESRYYYFILTRAPYWSYIRIKWAVACIVGGLAIVIPELVYYVVISLIFRNEILDPFMYEPSGIFASLFSTTPELYIGIVLITHFLLGAMFSAIAITLASLSKHLAVVYIGPFLLFTVSSIVLEAFLSLHAFSPLQWYQMTFSRHVEVYTLYIPLVLVILCSAFIYFRQAGRVITSG
ncbi:hypothetical protein [Paenibacillus sp. YYML68]|uniref:hypothetical protein n=1 Tax=Paenibacillus sp. YYML68 TaxID=2909250 RepID=UPI0024906DEC|nr:hypothetical protein [Paenibacillus sp. YYML68]